MNVHRLSLLCFLVTGAVLAAPTIETADGTCTVTVPAGEDYTLTAADVTALGTSVDLVKRGAGRLVIATNLKDANWGGELRVEEGYLRVKAVGALGTTTKGTVVSDGATLEIDGSTAGANKIGFVGESLTICGRGVVENGVEMGVLRNIANDQYPGISPVTMTGDCLYTTAKASSYRWDIRSGVFDMGGHTLTTRGYFALTLATVANPGNIVVEEGTFVIESACSLGGGAANHFTLAAGSRLWLQGSRTDLPWTLVLNDGCEFRTVSAGTAATCNVWAGPVELVSGTAKLYSDYRYSPLKITGNITGAGGINATAPDGGTLRLLGAANTFTGGLTVSGSFGAVFAATPGALPHGADAGGIRLTGTGARLFLDVGDDATADAWSADDCRDVVARTEATGGGSAVLMQNAAGETKTFADDVTDNLSIGHAGAGTLALTGAWQTGDLSNDGGEITVPGDKATHVRFLDLAGGTLRIPSGGLVYSHTNAWLGAKWPDVARIVVENGGCYMTSNASPKGVYPMTVGRSRAFFDKQYRGILEVQDGACLTGRVCVGNGQGSTDAAALYLRAGAKFRSFGTGYSCDMYVGSGGSAYVELDAWTYLPGWTIVGIGAWGRAVWVQKGGAVSMNGDAFSIGASGGRGEAYFCGGTFTSSTEIHVGKSVWAYTGMNSHAALTVADGGMVICKNAIDLAMQTNCLAALNLNGGVLQAKYVQKMTNLLQMVSSSGRKEMAFSGNSAFVNFNGGTFMAYQSGELFPCAPDRVTVNAGGAVLDTAGFDCSVGVPLEAPTGRGVASIPLPDACTVPWNYIGSPYVAITGDGTNAWAHAVYDSVNGVVTGIEIVNPGLDYTQAAAEIYYGGWTNRITLANLPLADNAPGGLTKKGGGTLSLNATNTFQGAVTVAGGTLRAGTDRALPASAFDLAVTGGTLDGGGFEWTFGAISATSGRVTNVKGSSTAASLTKTGPGTFFLETDISVAAPITVAEGTFILPQIAAGLWQGARTYATSDERVAEHGTSPVFLDTISSDLVYLYTNGVSATSLWKDYMNVTYAGYIWNTNETEQTWCFGGVLDDGIKLTVDGMTVLDSRSWTVPKFGAVTVDPGAHSIYILAYNGTGGAGAVGCSPYHDWPARHGLVWNPDGAYNADGTVSTNFTDYVDLTDAARGAVLSTTVNGFAPQTAPKTLDEITVAAGATLAVGDGAYTFNTYRGLGNITGSTSIRNWVLDGAEVAAGGRMHVTGDLTFSEGAVFSFVNADRLPTSGAQITIGTVDGAVSGSLPSVRVPGSGVWSVYPSGHDLKLGLLKGTDLLFR